MEEVLDHGCILKRHVNQLENTANVKSGANEIPTAEYSNRNWGAEVGSFVCNVPVNIIVCVSIYW